MLTDTKTSILEEKSHSSRVEKNLRTYCASDVVGTVLFSVIQIYKH